METEKILDNYIANWDKTKSFVLIGRYVSDFISHAKFVLNNLTELTEDPFSCSSLAIVFVW